MSLGGRDGGCDRSNQKSVAGGRQGTSRPGIVGLRCLEYLQGQGSKECNRLVHYRIIKAQVNLMSSCL